MAYMDIKRLSLIEITLPRQKVVRELLTVVVLLASYRFKKRRNRQSKNLRCLLNLLIKKIERKNSIRALIFSSMLMT